MSRFVTHRTDGSSGIPELPQIGVRSLRRSVRGGARDCRERLIDATLNLCVRCGYETTTIDQIAAAAEATPSEFLRYFATKDAVLLCIVEDLLHATAAALANVDAAASPEQALLLATTEVVTGVGGADPTEERAFRDLVASTDHRAGLCSPELPMSVSTLALPVRRNAVPCPQEERRDRPCTRFPVLTRATRPGAAAGSWRGGLLILAAGGRSAHAPCFVSSPIDSRAGFDGGGMEVSELALSAISRPSRALNKSARSWTHKSSRPSMLSWLPRA